MHQGLTNITQYEAPLHSKIQSNL